MPYHLLIVDDENTIRRGLAGFMPWDAIDCVVDGAARDGAEALEMLQTGSPDIVITDIKMPRMDGIELAKYIHENRPWIKVIILTGYAEFEYAHSAISYGVASYVLKPVAKDTLIESVQKLIAQISRERTEARCQRQDAALLREELLRELAGGAMHTEKLRARAAESGVALDAYHAAVFDTGKDAAALTYAGESLCGEYPGDYVFTLNGRLFWVSRAGDGGFSRLSDTCAEIVNIGRLLYALYVSAGISGLHKGLAELPLAVTEAVSALGQNFYSNQSVSFYKADNSGPSARYIHDLCAGELFALEKRLGEQRFDEARQSAVTLFSRLKSLAAGEFDAKAVCIEIYYICASILLKNGLSLPPDSPQGGRTNFFQKVRDSRIINGLENAVIELLKNTADLLASQGRTASPLVKKALRYIHGHYHLDLSLELIAAEIHINPSHLSRTFKKELDKPVTEYINCIRIEKAKELLTVSGMLAYEAAEAVGFKDPAYFSQVFKKLTGVSPKDFKSSGLLT